MTARTRRWKSTSGETAGYELISRPLLPRELKVALCPALQSASSDGAFLLARLASSDHAGICAAIRAINDLGAKVRVALAIDLATLEGLEGKLPVTDAVGLVLDGVDVETPLSAFILDSIEAIRFDDEFIAAASRSLRIDAALRAMLFLANDLALGTFASEAVSSSYLLGSRPVFDYTTWDAAPVVVHDMKGQPLAETLHKTSRRGI